MHRIFCATMLFILMICSLLAIVNGAPSTKSPSKNPCCPCKPKGQDVIEEVVCKESDVPENGTKLVTFAGESDKVLLVKQGGKIYGIGAICSHYAVSLVNGAVGAGRIRCPAHGACFRLDNGDIEDAPGLDSVPCFGVEVLSNGDVKVCSTKKELANPRRVKPMVRKSAKSRETFVVVGGGAAGQSCAEVLRQEAFNGRLILLTEEKHLPYDRTKCNKNLDMTVDKMLLRPQEFFDQTDIEVITGEKVVKLDTANKTVATASGKTFNYTKVFLALGEKARKPTFMPNHDLKNIFTVRTVDDTQNIFQLLKPETKVVVIGSSFIGMETAASCVMQGSKNVTVVGRSDVPFLESLGKEIGQRIKEYCESKGIKYIKNKAVKFEGSDGKVTQVVLGDDVALPADICIVGVGGFFETEFLSDTGLNMTKKGTIVVNEFLETNIEGVYAGGDVAHAPVGGTNISDNIGHWQLAQVHGRRAAKNMLGKQVPINSVPFFYGKVFDLFIRYAGYGKGFEEVLTVGNLQDFKFITYYLKNGQVVAAMCIGNNPNVAKVAEMLYNGKTITKEEAIDNKWVEHYSIN